MELIKAYTAFDRKVDEFSFNMTKKLGSHGQQSFELTLKVPGYAPIVETTSSCPAEKMQDMMATHLKKVAVKTAPVKLVARRKLLIVP